MKQTFEHKFNALCHDEEGATLTELAIVIPTLLLLVMGATEFGRFGYNEVLAQKATDVAVRTAAVRPAVCAGVPEAYAPGTAASPRFGTLCRADTAGAICADVPQSTMPTCSLASPDATSTDAQNSANEIWATIAPMLPRDATPANVRITYTHDANIGFLGGPYTPIITVELVDIPFQTVTPLGALAAIATAGAGGGVSDTFTFPTMTASLPAEDLGQGLGDPAGGN